MYWRGGYGQEKKKGGRSSSSRFWGKKRKKSAAVDLTLIKLMRRRKVTKGERKKKRTCKSIIFITANERGNKKPFPLTGTPVGKGGRDRYRREKKEKKIILKIFSF